MKKHSFELVFSILVIIGVSLLLMSYSAKFIVASKSKKPRLSNEAFLKLVDDAFNNPIFKSIYTKDVDRIVLKMSKILRQEKNVNQITESQIQGNNIDSILEQLGFKSMDDFNSYANSFKLLADQFDIKYLEKEDISHFFTAIRSKEIEYIYNNELSETNIAKIFSTKAYGPVGPGGIKSECWKCVYDYRDCVNPYVGVLTTSFGTWPDGVKYIKLGTETHFPVLIITDFPASSAAAIVTMTTPTVTNQCDTYYKSCIANCNY